MVRASRRKFHFIYKTTCNVTGKFYIGMHSTDDLNDGYIGSGKRLWRSIRKYGREAHICEILEHCYDRNSLIQRERVLVDVVMLGDRNCMNLKLGGEGGDPGLTFEQRQIISQKRNELRRKKIQEDPIFKKQLQDIMKRNRISGNGIKQALLAASTKEAYDKRMESFKKIKHQQGTSNSQFGTKWVNKDGVNKKIPSDQVNSYLSDGYLLGRIHIPK